MFGSASDSPGRVSRLVGELHRYPVAVTWLVASHTHFSPHLLATTSHNHPQVPHGEKPQIPLRRNGSYNFPQLPTTSHK
jgi:hypothetical protein